MKKIIGYITRDEVNGAIAHRTPMPEDVQICRTDTDDGLPNAPLLGIVYDLDHLWDDDRERVLDRLTRWPPAQPTVVHSYDIDDYQSEQLRLMGVTVCRQVSEAMFQTLTEVAQTERRAA